MPRRHDSTRATLGWALSCILSICAMAEMAADNQGAKPVRTIAVAKAEAKPEDFT